MPNWCINKVEAAPEVLHKVTDANGWIDLSIVDESLRNRTFNAQNAQSTAETGKQTFITAHQPPMQAMKNLSALFPAEKIKIEFANEDLGDTCGTIVLLGGVYVERDVDPDQPNTESRRAWLPFARELWKGVSYHG
jgi:hypothetical protein